MELHHGANPGARKEYYKAPFIDKGGAPPPGGHYQHDNPAGLPPDVIQQQEHHGNPGNPGNPGPTAGAPPAGQVWVPLSEQATLPMKEKDNPGITLIFNKIIKDLKIFRNFFFNFLKKIFFYKFSKKFFL